jgi:hypothetical protein
MGRLRRAYGGDTPIPDRGRCVSTQSLPASILDRILHNTITLTSAEPCISAASHSNRPSVSTGGGPAFRALVDTLLNQCPFVVRQVARLAQLNPVKPNRSVHGWRSQTQFGRLAPSGRDHRIRPSSSIAGMQWKSITKSRQTFPKSNLATSCCISGSASQIL